MGARLAGSWDSARQAFADQFEQDTGGLVYRRSRKGEAIRVSAEERQEFIDGFDRDLWRAMFVMIASTTLMLGGISLLSVLKGWNLPEGVVVVGIFAASIPYFAYYRWAWGAPSRALEGRTPIARERSPDEVRQLRFQRMTYRNLAAAAGAAVVLPLVGSRHDHLFSGWGRLWLAAGAALLLFVGVQAFRKWQFDQQEGDRASSLPQPQHRTMIDASVQGPADLPDKKSAWRFVPLAVIALGFAFVAYTAAGHRFAQAPMFWPAVVAAIGAWALFSVAQGFRKGKVMPFIRGFADSYGRETQPKRFWASMAWNCALGVGLLWFALIGSGPPARNAVEEHCSNQQNEFPANESLDACTQLIDGRARLTYLSKDEAYVYRGLADASLGDRRGALADYSEAIRLNPSDTYAYLDRGLILSETMRLNEAVTDFSRAHELDPKSPWPLANRGLVYAMMKDSAHAEADFRAVEATDRSNAIVLRGRAVLSINDLDMADAVKYLTASLKRDPDNVWAVRTRAWAYRQLGDDQDADADIARYEKLSGRKGFITVSKS